MHPHSSFKKVGVWLCDTNTHRVNWKGKGEGGMTYECITSEVNQWKLNFLINKKNTRLNWWKGFLVWIVWRGMGPLGYFDFEFGGNTLKLLRRVITNVHAYQRVITCEVEQQFCKKHKRTYRHAYQRVITCDFFFFFWWDNYMWLNHTLLVIIKKLLFHQIS